MFKKPQYLRNYLPLILYSNLTNRKGKRILFVKVKSLKNIFFKIISNLNKNSWILLLINPYLQIWTWASFSLLLNCNFFKHSCKPLRPRVNIFNKKIEIYFLIHHILIFIKNYFLKNGIICLIFDFSLIYNRFFFVLN